MASKTKTLGMIPKDTNIRWNMTLKRNDYEDFYNIKYFNMFMSMFEVNCDALDNRGKYYLMKRLYTDGTVAVWNIKNTDMLGVAQYAASDFDMYDFPIAGTLVNKRGVSEKIIPVGILPINAPEGFVVGYIMPNHRSIASTVQLYARRLAEIDMVINTNLEVHKLPYIIATNDNDAKRLKDMVQRILNNEVAVFANVADVDAIRAISTAAPYVIDKLTQFKQSVENELKTYLGVQNHNTDTKSTYINADETNANNQEISSGSDAMTDMLVNLTDDVKKYLSKSLTFTKRDIEVQEDAYANDRGTEQGLNQEVDENVGN